MKKLALALTVLGLAACQQKTESPASATPPAQQALRAAAPAPATAAGPAAHESHEGNPEHGAAAAEPAKTADAAGATANVVGQKLAGLPVVAIAELLAKPEQYAGKSVRLEGAVTGMCYHRRGWFAVQEVGPQGGFVRVITAPGFLVPEGSVGKQVRTEGVVEVTEVAESDARHYAKDHALGDPNAVKGPIKAVIVRATGAEFI